MKRKNLYKIQAAAVLVTALCCASCSDTWDDHYSENSASAVNETLWQAINENSELSNFAKVAKACGYDLTLNGSQTFSVFAPTNGSFTEEQADALIASYNEQKAAGVKSSENTVIKQFLQNHIAPFKKSVSSETADSLTMMNGKRQKLSAAAVGDEEFQTKNVLYNNGILYTIEGKLNYEPNIFEYLRQDAELDSVYQFFNDYGVYKFSPSQSVAGSIVDGKTQYLDSVMVYNNRIMNQLGQINSEDSTYWMLAPNNAEWKRMVETYSPYFNYDATVENRDSLQRVNTRLAILGATLFSRSNNPDAAFQDSALSTSAYPERYYTMYPEEKRYNRFYHPFAAGGIFDGAADVALSNGHIMKTANFRISPYDTFVKELKIETEYTNYVDTLTGAIDPYVVRRIPASSAFYNQVSSNSFAEIAPSNLSEQPSVTFAIPGVLSNVPYDVYAVFVPAIAYDELATDEQRLPVKIRTQVGYQNNGATKWERNSAFTVKADVIDTIKIKGNYKFKTTAYGLDKAQAKVKIYTDVPSSMTAKYQRTMRIDCIIIKPHNAPASEAKRIKISY